MTMNDEQQNCPYCHGKEPIWDGHGPHGIVLSIIYGNFLDAFSRTVRTGQGSKINYCPMCGRRLVDE